MKHLSLGALLILGSQIIGFAQAYTLTIEDAPAVGTGGTVYRFYVNSNDPTDKISAVYGNNNANLIINTPSGIFNSPYNAGWNAAGVSSLFLGVFPDLADDSYATIGLSGPATEGAPGSADPSLVEDAAVGNPVSTYFIAGGNDLTVTTLTGASWYVLNTAANALPDGDGRWLIAQITTAGTISGQIPVQVFPLGVGADQIQGSATFDGVGTYEFACLVGCPTGGPGCTDSSACNYDSGATEDDGSCEFTSCLGCTDSVACNYDSEATQDDGSCDYCSCGGSEIVAYPLVVESAPAAAVVGATVYRFYVQMSDPADRMSAVFGNTVDPLLVTTPDGVFNSGLNTGWNAAGVNAALFGLALIWRTTPMPPLAWPGLRRLASPVPLNHRWLNFSQIYRLTFTGYNQFGSF